MSLNCGHQRAYYSSPRWYMSMVLQRNDSDKVKPKNSEKTCPSATLSTTNPTWTDQGANPGLRSEGQTTNRLSHGTALKYSWYSCQACKWNPESFHWNNNIHNVHNLLYFPRKGGCTQAYFTRIQWLLQMSCKFSYLIIIIILRRL
jgi:hypothetical protein